MKTSSPAGKYFSRRTLGCAGIGLVCVLVVLFLIGSLNSGGHVAGFTYVQPGDVGLVLDNYTGNIETNLFPAGTHWQGPWETVIEVPTMQRTINLDNDNAVQVNTSSNMLTVDASCQYRIDPERAKNLYDTYQDQFSDMSNFEAINLIPAVKEAVNYAIGDMDTATALSTVGKQQAEAGALKSLNDEWAPQGIEFSQFMIRGVRQEAAAQQLLSTTLSKMQDISNARIALQQQQIDNQTTIQAAIADAKVNRLQNAALTDLYVQDQELSRVHTMYVPSGQLLDMLSSKGGKP